MKNLSRDDRLRLMKFVCSFAWADLKIKPEEKALIADLVRRLDLDAEESAQVSDWLKVPPVTDDLDPSEIPRAHRQMFLDQARAIIKADGVVAPVEVDSYALLEQLVE